MAEDAFMLDNIGIVIDMGLTSWRSNVTSIGSNQIRLMGNQVMDFQYRIQDNLGR